MTELAELDEFQFCGLSDFARLKMATIASVRWLRRAAELPAGVKQSMVDVSTWLVNKYVSDRHSVRRVFEAAVLCVGCHHI